MENKEIVNQIKRCLVGACDETCPYYHYEDRFCDNMDKFVPMAEEFLNNATSMMDKEEQGLLLELPVKLGTMVFCIDTEWEDDSEYYVINEYKFRVDMIDEWGKWVFATEAEAEEALAKMGGK